MSQPKKILRNDCQDKLIQGHEAHDQAIYALCNATASKVEIHAKLYLEADLLKFLRQHRRTNCVIAQGVTSTPKP